MIFWWPHWNKLRKSNILIDILESVHSLPVKLKNPARYFMGGIFCFSIEELEGLDYFSPELDYSDHNPVVMRMKIK